MGWNSGGELFDRLIVTVYKNVDSSHVRKRIYTDMIEAFEDHDCDILEECMGVDPTFDEIMKGKIDEH